MKRAKYSSAVGDLLKRISATGTDEEKWKILASAESGIVRDLFDKVFYQKRKEILFELVNLHDGGIERFQRNRGDQFRHLPDPEIMKLRNDRRIWESDIPSAEKQQIFERWSQWKPEGFLGLGYRVWVPLLSAGRVVANTRISTLRSAKVYLNTYGILRFARTLIAQLVIS